MDALVTLIIFIVIVGAIAYIGYWAAGRLLPEPIRVVAQVLIVVIAALLILVKAWPALNAAI